MFWRQIDLGLYPDGTENFMLGSVPLYRSTKAPLAFVPCPLFVEKLKFPRSPWVTE